MLLEKKIAIKGDFRKSKFCMDYMISFLKSELPNGIIPLHLFKLFTVKCKRME